MPVTESEKKLRTTKLSLFQKLEENPSCCELFYELFISSDAILKAVGEDAEAIHAFRLNLTAIHKQAGCTTCVNSIMT